MNTPTVHFVIVLSHARYFNYKFRTFPTVPYYAVIVRVTNQFKTRQKNKMRKPPKPTKNLTKISKSYS